MKLQQTASLLLAERQQVSVSLGLEIVPSETYSQMESKLAGRPVGCPSSLVSRRLPLQSTQIDPAAGCGARQFSQVKPRFLFSLSLARSHIPLD